LIRIAAFSLDDRIKSRARVRVPKPVSLVFRSPGISAVRTRISFYSRFSAASIEVWLPVRLSRAAKRARRKERSELDCYPLAKLLSQNLSLFLPFFFRIGQLEIKRGEPGAFSAADRCDTVILPHDRNARS